MVDKSNANFVTINFNYIFHIDLKYLFLSFNLIIRKWFLKKMFSEKKIYFTLKRQPIVSETDSFFIIFILFQKIYILF